MTRIDATHVGASVVLVSRRHVDLLRVSSAACHSC